MQCAATKKSDGLRCKNKAKYGDFCGVHKSKVATGQLNNAIVEDPGHYVPVTSINELVTDAEGLKATILRHGFAIIPDVLDASECAEMNSGCWDFFEALTQEMPVPMQRDDDSTWITNFELYPKHGMLHQHWGIGHADYIWKVRQNSKVVDIFSKLWSCEPEDLLVSFDGASFGVPPEITKRGYYRNNRWYHFDQRLSDPRFQCVQSWVTANDVFEGDATLTVLEGSNTQREFFASEFNMQSETKDWIKISDEHISWFEERGCVVREIQCTAGSMVFWDSRTAHAGKEPLKVRDHQTFRNVVYLCYTPRELASQAMLKKKRKAYEENRTTSHWPHKPKLFPVKPRTYGNPMPEVVYQPVPELDELGRRLAGYEE